MKNLRQLLRRPVRECESTMWSEERDDGNYAIYLTCSHLKWPRQYILLPSLASSDQARQQQWERVRADLDTHVRYSDPW